MFFVFVVAMFFVSIFYETSNIQNGGLQYNDFEVVEELRELSSVILAKPTQSSGVWCIGRDINVHFISQSMRKEFSKHIPSSCHHWIGRGSSYVEGESEEAIFSLIKKCRNIPILLQIEEDQITLENNLANFIEGMIDDSQPIVRLHGIQIPAKSVTVVIYTNFSTPIPNNDIENHARKRIRNKWSDRFLQRLSDVVSLPPSS